MKVMFFVVITLHVCSHPACGRTGIAASAASAASAAASTCATAATSAATSTAAAGTTGTFARTFTSGRTSFRATAGT